ncbi:hypothetical protein [Deinococcus sp.]|uniref:hypothetical protein n=1 Tax=Deinococcus sp. TaxID=47478 RepID=UPI003CC5DA56
MCSSALLLGYGAGHAHAAPVCTPIPGAAHALISVTLNGQRQDELFIISGSRAATDSVTTSAPAGELGTVWLPTGTLAHWDLEVGTPETGCVADEPGAVYERLPEQAGLSLSYNPDTAELQITAPASAFHSHRIDLLASAQDESEPASATSLRYGVHASYDRDFRADANVTLLHLEGSSAYGASLNAASSQSGFSLASPELWYSLALGGGKLRLGTGDPASAGAGAGFAGVSYVSADPGSTLPSVSGSTDVPAHYVISVFGYSVATGELTPGSFTIDHVPVPEGRGTLTLTLYDPLRPGRVLGTQTQPFLHYQALLKPGTVKYELDAGYRGVFSAGRSLYGLADLTWGLAPDLGVQFRVEGGPEQQTASASAQYQAQNFGAGAQVTALRVGEGLGLSASAHFDVQPLNSPFVGSVNAQWSGGDAYAGAAGLVLGAGVGYQQRPYSLGLGVTWSPATPSPWGFRANAAYQLDRNLILDAALTGRGGSYNVQIGLLYTFRPPAFLSGADDSSAERLFSGSQGALAVTVSTSSDNLLGGLQPEVQLETPLRDARLRLDAGLQGAELSGSYGVLFPITASVGLNGGYRDLSVSASVSGALAYIGGTLLPLAPNVGNVGEVLLGYPGVRVYVNGNLVGTSDAQGKTLVSGLLPGSLNEVSFAAEDLPPEITVDRDSAKVYVGVFDARRVDFRPALHRGTLVTLLYKGQPVPESARVVFGGLPVSVGSKGQVYLYDAQEGQELRVKASDFECTVTFHAQDVLDCQEVSSP